MILSEYHQKTFVKCRVEDSGRAESGRGSEWICLKKKICDKNLFLHNAEWTSKKLWKMISAVNVKANIKQ